MDGALKIVLSCFAFGLVAFLAGNPDVSLFRAAAVGIVLLAVVSFILSTCVVPFLERRHQQHVVEAAPTVSEEELERRRQDALDRLAAHHAAKVEGHAAHRAQRDQQKLDAQENSLHQFSPVWKGRGESVRGESTHQKPKPPTSSSAKQESRAALSGTAAREIRVDLEPEPEADDANVTTLSIRKPNGGLVRRRFRLSSPLLQLHGYVESLGYAPSQYAVYTLWPRKKVEMSEEIALSQLSPGKGLAVAIEEHDDAEAEEEEEQDR